MISTKSERIVTDSTKLSKRSWIDCRKREANICILKNWSLDSYHPDVRGNFSKKGRIHLNVGGAGAIGDAISLVRNYTHKNAGFAFMGGDHGRTLGATAITSSYRHRGDYGHFGDRAHFVPYPHCFRCFYGLKRDDCDLCCLSNSRSSLTLSTIPFGTLKPGNVSSASDPCSKLLVTLHL